MEKIFVFRVLIDYEKDVFRDIHIKSSQTFSEFHKAIQNAFDFDGQQMASFYMSNEDWDKGEEIAMEHISENQSNPLMHETNLEQMVEDVGQKLVYVSDFLLMWCFFIELVKIEEPNIKGIGEIFIKGPSVMRAYFSGIDEQPSFTMKEDWMSTGDLGYLSKDGFLTIIDRSEVQA